jgi:aspartate/methionine/tyrosine aminotransferase
MEAKPSRRMVPITSFIVMDIMEEAFKLEQAGVDVVHLEVGEPDFPPPAAVVEALARAARDGHTHYTHSLGVLALREAIAAWYGRHYGVTVDPGRVIVMPGTSGAFLNVLGVMLDPGDRILFTDPGYPCYPNFARVLGAEPAFVPVDAEDGFTLDRGRVERALAEQGARAKALMVASPANPTGAIIEPETLRWLTGLPVPLISDEIYHGLVYCDDCTATALQFSDDVVVINGLSKRYAMTGLRIGWAIVPKALVRDIQKLNQNIFICADSVSQQAAVTALTDPSCDEAVRDMVATYGRRRRVLLDGLRRLGFVLHHEPRGAFYVFADISRFGHDGFEFARRAMVEANVACTPGVDFGHHRTKHFVRFAYTRDEARIEEGLHRLGRWLGVSRP